MNRLVTLSTLGLALLSGCATTSTTQQQTPLLFISTNSFGVDIGASPSSATLPAINLGLKTLDVAIVPITTDGNTAEAIRGCYNTGVNATVTPCSDTVAGNRPAAPPANAGAGAAVQMAQAQPLRSTEPRTMAIPVMMEAAPISGRRIGTKAAPVELPKDATFNQSMRDSLSVFSSFNADTKVGQEASIQLGKAFATGVAAQQLTEGFNTYLQYKGLALIGSDPNTEIALRSECLAAVIAAKDKKVPDASLPNCGEKGLTTEGLKVRTACAQTLKTAMEKSIAADQLPKCGG